eukprot:TRINITY_DN43625_c0_g1_i1.p1 TRINITY_DN43625_c0_g1~~TRINITY_DN43625_c0_g1_i1.p1  ORF type:complete len:259 (-),score=57.83 TRINITY_DN43625_c0_g1_i1:377-1153(-)
MFEGAMGDQGIATGAAAGSRSVSVIQEAIHVALRSQGLQVAPATVAFLTEVLAELRPEELVDSGVVRALLEPFLHDALTSGRERPTDRKKGARVAAICDEVRSRLCCQDGIAPKAAKETQAVSSLVTRTMAAATPVDAHASTSADSRSRVDAAAAALRRALQTAFESELQLLECADSAQALLAIALSELSDAEAADPKQLASLLEPVVLDAFHEQGDWPASDDVEQLLKLGGVLSRELLLARQSTTASTPATVPLLLS